MISARRAWMQTRTHALLAREAHHVVFVVSSMLSFACDEILDDKALLKFISTVVENSTQVFRIKRDTSKESKESKT